MIATEYDERVKELSKEVGEKEKKLEEIEKKYSDYRDFEMKRTYSIEKKHRGLRVLIHKKEDEVKIVDEKNNDVTKYFPTIVSQALHLSENSFVIDCSIVKNKGFESIDKKSLIEKGHTAFVSDCVYFEDDITYLNLVERKKILNGLNFSDNIKNSASIIVDNPEDAEKAIKMFDMMKDGDGALIKKLNSKYFLNDGGNCFCYHAKRNV